MVMVMARLFGRRAEEDVVGKGKSRPVPNIVLFNLRHRLAQSQEDVADALNALAAARGQTTAVAGNHISRWERGIVFPSPLYRQLLAEHFQVSAVDLGLVRQRATSFSAERQIGQTSHSTPPPATDGDGVAELAWREPGRMVTALDTTSVSSDRLTSLFQEVNRLGTQVVKVPPGTLMMQTLMIFREVRELIGAKQTLSSHRELVKVAAMLGTVVGEIVFLEGQFSLAQHWYNVARRAALDVGDQYLADIALCGSAYLPTYSADPSGVLALVSPRLDEDPAASPATAWLWAFRAKAHALLDEGYAFETCIERARRTLEDSPNDLVRPGIFSFLPEKLAFYEARGRVDLGDGVGAIVAAQRASNLYDVTDTTEPALVRFEQASALVQSGEVPEACRVANSAVLDRHTYHGVSIITRAWEFDRLLGTSTQEEIREWREVLATLRPSQLILAGTEQADGGQ
jgi:transcriptional regulator with XRE-family HTH domain